MSDRGSDDTDVLLNSDPMGGLFNGLSLKELSEKHMNLLSSENDDEEVDKNQANGNAALNNLELDSSDYFNSKGEIVFSGLSEWTDSDGEKSDADGETLFSYKSAPPKKPEANGEIKKKNCSNSGDLTLEEEKDVQKQTEQTASEQPLNNNSIQSQTFHPQFLNHGQVFDINLQNSATGWNIPLPSFLQGSGDPSGVIMTENGEQIFTRAPNFRSPGGYRSLNNQKPSREMTEQQVSEEVKRMYEYPEQFQERDENFNPTSPPTPRVLRFADEINQEYEEASKVNTKEFDFLNGENLVSFDSPKSSNDAQPNSRKKNIASKGKRKPKKLQGAGDGMTSPDSSSPSVTTFSEVNNHQDSPLVIPTPTTSAEKGSSVPYCTKVIRGMKRSNPKASSIRPGFSFGYGESENDLSPIGRKSNSVNNSYMPTRPSSHHREVPTPKTGAEALNELKTIWREIQLSRSQIGILDQEDEESYIEDLGHVSPTPKSDRTHSNSHQNHNFKKLPDMSDNFDSDLETLLNEAEINPTDFEDIVDDLDIAECYVGEGIDDLLKEIVDPDTSPKAKEQAQLSHWAKSGAVEYVEKYHEEHFRRRECEEEITRLQKEILEIKQCNAVLQGTMKRKDGTILKITKAWKKLATDWNVLNEELNTKVKKLTISLENAQLEKEKLMHDLESSTTQKLKDEQERLHEYYNKKLQDALKLAAQKSQKAETKLMDSMKKSSLDNELKLAECKERFHADLTRMKTIYEVEIQDLKKDNLQKQLLISTTAKQLQTGGGIGRQDSVNKHTEIKIRNS